MMQDDHIHIFTHFLFALISAHNATLNVIITDTLCMFNHFDSNKLNLKAQNLDKKLIIIFNINLLHAVQGASIMFNNIIKVLSFLIIIELAGCFYINTSDFSEQVKNVKCIVILNVNHGLYLSVIDFSFMKQVHNLDITVWQSQYLSCIWKSMRVGCQWSNTDTIGSHINFVVCEDSHQLYLLKLIDKHSIWRIWWGSTLTHINLLFFHSWEHLKELTADIFIVLKGYLIKQMC